MGTTLISALALACTIALTIISARMGWMKDRPGMFWVFIILGLTAVVLIGWQGYRNSESGRESRETLVHIREQVELLVRNSPMNRDDKAKMLDEVRKVFVVDLHDKVGVNASIDVQVFRAGSTAPADPQSPQSPKRGP
jgi:hypothetical protein